MGVRISRALTSLMTIAGAAALTLCLGSLGFPAAMVHAAGGQGGFYTGQGGTILITSKKIPPTEKSCPAKQPTQDMYATEMEFLAALAFEAKCEGEARAAAALGDLPGPPPKPLSAPGLGGATTHNMPRRRDRAADALRKHVLAATSVATAFPTPFLPFLGNTTTLLSLLPSSDDTNLYSLGLRRQADCSTVQDIVQPASATPNEGLIASLPAFQDHFHSLSGLATTPDVFANGCAEPVLGVGTTNNIHIVGTTPAGATVAVEETINGELVVSTADPVADTYTATTLLAVNAFQGNFAVADLNGDGKNDIVVTFVTHGTVSEASTVVFLGNGDGTFQAAAYYDVPGDIVIDDVNGDGKPDIVVLTNPGVTTLLGNGDGTFHASAVSATARTAYGEAAGQVIAGDFNGDGKKDLLAAGTVLLGAGDGTFTVGTPITGITTDPFLSSGFTAAGDLNKDGKLDVVAQAAGVVAVFLGNGDGTFTAGQRYASIPDKAQIEITDLDGDGNSDLVIGTIAGGIYTDTAAPELKAFQVIPGRGDGTFVDAVVYPAGQSAFGGVTAVGGDFNGDGKVDVLTIQPNLSGSGPGSLALLPGDGAGSPGAALSSTMIVNPTVLATGDANKDGKPDAIIGGGTGVNPILAVLLNQGQGAFGAEHDYPLPDFANAIVTGDFNGDGRMDVAVAVSVPVYAQPPGVTGVVVLLGQPDGTLGAPVQIDTSHAPLGIAAGDLNGDGRTDLIVTDEGVFNPGATTQAAGAVHVYLGTADGTFAAAAAPTTTATNYSSTALADFNGDGKLDLLVAGDVADPTTQSGTANLYVLLGNGDGTFKSATVYPLSGSDGIGATSIVIADFNGDGKLDAALGNPSDFTDVFLGNGDGTFSYNLMVLAQRPQFLASAALSNAQYPDLLVGTPSGLAVYLNTPSAAAWTRPAATTTTPPPVVAADFSATLSSSSGAVAAGQSATATVTVAPTGGFNQAVLLTCAGLPDDVTCSFSPASLTPDGTNAATSTLTLSTVVRVAANVGPSPAFGSPFMADDVVLGTLAIPVLAGGRRRRRPVGRWIPGFAGLMLGAVLLHGCGGDHAGTSKPPSPPLVPPPSGTAAGAYAITVTATSGAIVHSATYTLTVT